MEVDHLFRWSLCRHMACHRTREEMIIGATQTDFFFFFWSKLRCDFSQVPWEHTHIFLPTLSVSQQLSHCGTWEANLDVWELGRHSLWKLRVSLTCWEAEPLRIRGGTPQSSQLRSEGSLAKKQPAFVAESTKGSRLLRWLRGKESACQCRKWKRHSFDPWVRKIPWRMKWQSTPVSTLAWEILWTEEPGGLQSTGLQRVRQQKQLSMQHACLQGSELRTGVQKLHHLWRSQLKTQVHWRLRFNQKIVQHFPLPSALLWHQQGSVE